MTQAFKRCSGCGANNDTRNVICHTCGKQLDGGASFSLPVPCEVIYGDGTTASGPAPLPRMSPRQQDYAQLLMRGMAQLRAWHAKYGEHQPQWLPPAGDVRWLEDAQAYLDGVEEVRGPRGEPGSGKLATPSGPAREPGSAGCDSTGRQIDAGAAPVAYVVYAPNGNVRLWSTKQQEANRCAVDNGLTVVPLYAHPNGVPVVSPPADPQRNEGGQHD